jgi:hypothetical protein
MNESPIKRVFRMSLKDLNTVLQFASAVLLGLTFAVGAGAIITGFIIGKRQDELIATTGRDAAEANRQAAEAGQGTARALAEAAAANERAAGLEAKAAQLQLDLERERAARLPRSIGAQDRAKLLACLKAGPKGPVVVMPKTFDEEAEAYATQISQVLKDAQFEIRALTGPRPFGFGVSGAFMWVSDISNPPPHAAHIQTCFHQVGVELAAHGDPKVVTDPTAVAIAISSKP